MYQQMYDLIVNLVFDGDLGPWMYGAFFAEGIAACATLFMMALPFVVVWRIVRRFL